MKRLILALALLLVSVTPGDAILFAGDGGITLPTAIQLNGSTIQDNAATSTVVGVLSTSGGSPPYTYTDTDNTKFSISGNNLIRSASGTLTAGVSESVNIRSCDNNSNCYTTVSPFSITVTAHTSGSLLTTLVLSNTSGSTQATNFITPMFGHAFKKGDVPSGQYPQFQLADATPVPCSQSINNATWADGSLKFASFMCRVPSTIAGSSTLTLNVFNGGSAPTASGRALSDFAASSLDLNVSVTGLDNLTGDWTSDLNQGISANGADYVYMDGPAGKVWRVRAAFRQSSADHGQLEGWWYVAALQDNSAALAGVRYLPGATEPYYNVVSPAPNWRSFTALTINNGVSQVADMWTASHGAGRTFTWSSGTTLNATAHAMETGWAVRLTTTGTLPTGLSTGTTYFVYKTGPNTFALGTNAAAVSQGSTLITETGAGTGTQTITPYPYLSQFGTMYLANTNGTWRFIQGGGSFSADSTVRVLPSNTYLRSTKLIPSFAFGTYTPDACTAYPYFPDTAGPVERYFENTGERDDIGPTTSWSARYLFLQSANCENTLRTVALVGGELPIRLRDSSTHAIPVVNNTTYTGMPAHNSTFRWYGSSSNISGFTGPTDTNVYVAGFSTPDSSHLPDFTYVAYIATGEPQYMDQIAEFANLDVMSRYTASGTASVGATTSIGGNSGGQRINVISGTTYYGITLGGGNLLRTDAWAIRDVGAAAGILPDTNPENSSYATYFTDLSHATFDAGIAYLALLQSGASFAYSKGLWNETENGDGGVSDAWASGYFTNGVALNYARTEDADALTFLNYIVAWPKFIHDTYGVSYNGYYQALVRQATNSVTSPFVTSSAGIAFYGWSVSWDGSTDVFTQTVAPTGSTLTNGDIFMFNQQKGAVPGGLSGETPYYVVNKSGSTFKLSATLGGSAIDITTTSSNGEVYGYSSSLASPSIIATAIGSGYVANILAGLNYSTAVGATVDSTTKTDLNSLLTAQAGYVAAFNTDPKYAVQATP